MSGFDPPPSAAGGGLEPKATQGGWAVTEGQRFHVDAQHRHGKPVGNKLGSRRTHG